ncbi:hypothetical protein JOQ06_015813 [Pogonophryne albipinna]|uniref:C-type lectin domain-containing protein n=1 Tax=Pogonophryne albipinna TaxID=1090488 RepID=A0AAD6ANJ6_9TELE|nr:hypothetical protein JOQ06_015813 [Pogonophryne albipinna]
MDQTGLVILLLLGLYQDRTAWKWSLDNTYVYGDDGNIAYGDWFVFQINHYSSSQVCGKVTGGNLSDLPCEHQLNSVCYDEPNNKYIPVTVPMTWSSAQSYCREKYTDLTSMRTQQEKEEILKVTDESSWWIGVDRKLWNWPDRSISSLALWTTGDPNGGASELCVVSYLGGWADVDCGLSQIKLLKIELKSDASLDLNDPSVHEDLLNHMEKHMRGHGIHQKFTLRWRKPPSRKVDEKEVEPLL